MATASEIIASARTEARTVLTEMESKQLLVSSLGIPTTEMELAASREEAVTLSKAIGYPCVLKVLSRDISHKSDAGGVKVGLKSEEEAGAGLRRHHGVVRGRVPDAVIEA